ncbi:putative ABC transport system permease protein [Gilliamella bombicola]|uniref:Putative ABC transport system permease protein n=1 Tax=Gilliamella bombicola TaxID=1798182 RepID=A0A1C4DE51_9GAMM|nr:MULTISPECIES: ABC transporter permease [Gilliamella]NUF28401.1 ABC transporter permease [Gilliamella sp. ESL0254]SCC29655.1 putative ABC transport system permease protein [Gilliamella bombicola]
MSFEFLLGSTEIGLIYALVSLGVFISFRLLDFPDLTADGSFPLGGAVCGVFIYIGADPWMATFLGMFAGCLAGAMTGFLYVKLNILQLLASIIVMMGLYSINLRILGVGHYVMNEANRIVGTPNLSLLGSDTIFSSLPFDESIAQYLIILGFVIVFWILLNLFLNTQKGLALRATGTNQRMAKSQGIPTDGIIILGMAISNGLIALGGSLFVQTQGSADITIGVGTIVIGLASIILGESIFPTKRIWSIMFAIILGSILYRLFIAFALSNESLKSIGVGTEDLNIITALLMVLALVLPKQLKKLSKNRGK